MICYPEDATKDEILMINDFWRLAEDGSYDFLYSIKKVQEMYSDKDVRSVYPFMKKTMFVLNHSGFFCRDCLSRSPVSNRTHFKERIKHRGGLCCQKCRGIRQESIKEKSRRII